MEMTLRTTLDQLTLVLPLGNHYPHRMTMTSQSDCPVEVEVDYTPGSPGKLSGPPEDCYPADEGEMDITKITLLEDLVFEDENNEVTLIFNEGTQTDHLVFSNSAAFTRLDERVWDLAIESMKDRADAAACSRWEAQQENKRMGEY
jgi:hypothetical protein